MALNPKMLKVPLFGGTVGSCPSMGCFAYFCEDYVPPHPHCPALKAGPD